MKKSSVVIIGLLLAVVLTSCASDGSNPFYTQITAAPSLGATQVAAQATPTFPSETPTLTPSSVPMTAKPTAEPTAAPSLGATQVAAQATPTFPSKTPTLTPSLVLMTAEPTAEPTAAPSLGATQVAAQATPTLFPSETPTLTPSSVPMTAEVMLEEQIGFASAFFMDGGENFERVLQTEFAVVKINDRYVPVAPTSTDVCASGSLTCPPWTFLVRVTQSDDCLQSSMPISYRIETEECQDEQVLRLQLVFGNTNDFRLESIQEAYGIQGLGAELGLFIGTTSSSMDPVKVSSSGSETIEVGVACNDCTPNTGSSVFHEGYLDLNDPSIFRFGGNALWLSPSPVGVVFSIPRPTEESVNEWGLDLQVIIPPGTKVVMWVGQFDVPTPEPTTTPTVDPSSVG